MDDTRVLRTLHWTKSRSHGRFGRRIALLFTRRSRPLDGRIVGHLVIRTLVRPPLVPQHSNGTSTLLQNASRPSAFQAEQLGACPITTQDLGGLIANFGDERRRFHLTQRLLVSGLVDTNPFVSTDVKLRLCFLAFPQREMMPEVSSPGLCGLGPRQKDGA